ncbi:MAG: methyl-accepting chemotaxis protein [Candidatus Edwardsbacteria bacterium]
MKREIVLKIYAWTITILGLGVLISQSFTLPWESVVAIFLFAAIGIGLSFFEMVMSSGIIITPLFIAAYASFLALGPVPCGWTILIASLFLGIKKKRPLERVLFGLGQFAISALFTGVIFDLIGGKRGYDLLSAENFVALIIGVIAFKTPNNFFVWSYSFIQTKTKIKELIDLHKIDCLVGLILVPFSALAAYIYFRFGLLEITILILPLLAISWAIITLLKPLIQKGKVSLGTKILGMTTIILYFSLMLCTAISLMAILNIVRQQTRQSLESTAFVFKKENETAPASEWTSRCQKYQREHSVEILSVFLTDISGKILAHSRPEKVGLTYVPSKAEFDCAFPFSDNSIFLHLISSNILLERKIRPLLRLLMLVFLLSFALAIFVMQGYIWTTLTKPVKKITSGLQEIARGEGDLTKKLGVYSEDEIGELANSFNEFLEGTRRMVEVIIGVSQELAETSHEIVTSIEEVTTGSQEIALRSTTIASGAEGQNLAVKNALERTLNLVSHLEEIEQHSREIEEKISNLVRTGIKGEEYAANALEKLNKITKFSLDNLDKTKELQIRSKEIMKVLETISQFTRKTNLLALNAAIESAQAKEFGLGFAVVAAEVKRLAEGSEIAAKEIEQIVRSLSFSIEEVLVVNTNAVQEIGEGKTQVDSAVTILLNIEEEIEKTASRVETIFKKLESQKTEIEDLVNAIRAVSEISNQSAVESKNVSETITSETTSLEEISRSAERGAELAERLKTLIAKFKI